MPKAASIRRPSGPLQPMRHRRREKTSRRLAMNFTPRAYADPESVSCMRLEDNAERAKTAQINA
jgi:hypothetical protein